MFTLSASLQCAVYLESPLVKSLFNCKAKEMLLVRYFTHCMRLLDHMAVFKWDHRFSAIFPITSICNHSCDPNVHASTQLGEVKLMVIRPIRKGEQIFISYGPVWYMNGPRKGSLMNLIGFQCKCSVCDDAKRKQWQATAKKLGPTAVANIVKVQRIIADPRSSMADIMNMLQQLIKRYVRAHPGDMYCMFLVSYTTLLNEAAAEGAEGKLRARTLEIANVMLSGYQ